METVVSTPVEPELNLITKWGEPDDADRRRKALIATILFHLAAISILFLLPESFFENKRPLPEPAKAHHADLRTADPINSESAEHGQGIEGIHRRGKGLQAPPDGPPAHSTGPSACARIGSATRSAPREEGGDSATPPPKPVQNAQPLPEPPKVDATINAPKVDLPQLGTIPPPKIQAQEQPKLALQNMSPAAPPVVPPERRRVPLPDTSVDGAIQRSIAGRPIASARPAAGYGEQPIAAIAATADGRARGRFYNYLRQILQTVRRNWQSVIPESVRLGRRGKCLGGAVDRAQWANRKAGIQRAIGHRFAGQSGGSRRQHVPTVSAPAAEFKGEKIVVQFNFAYNAPKQ